MSFVFSKNKVKRSRSPTGNSNNSFVRNVTSRVSGLLPAGITKWFSSPSSSRTNGSAAVADGTDSSTEDEAPESCIVAPPAKRLRTSSPVKYSQLTTSETTLTSNVVTESGSVLYQTIQTPPGRPTYKQNFNSTPIRAHSDGMNINIMMDQTETDDLQQNAVSVIDRSNLPKRNSLFDNDAQQEESLMTACAKTASKRIRDLDAPYFKPELLCSPFYSGSTMYGGASSSAYINEPNIKRRKVTNINEYKNAESVNLSTSSRVVMDLFENYSSPLIDARRIPRYELSELRDVNRSLPEVNTSARKAYKTQDLYIPSSASVIRMKARSRLMDSTKAARQIIASHSSSLSFHGYDPINRDSWSEQSTSQSKLKTRLTRTNRGGDLFGMPESLDLPTAVLQIDNKDLPNFSNGGSVPKPSLNPPSSEEFKFSNPVLVDLAQNSTYTPRTSSPAFEFGIQDKATDISLPNVSFGNQILDSITDTKEFIQKQSNEKSVITFAKAATKSKDWKCNLCNSASASNKADKQICVCCGANQVSQKTAPKAIETTGKCSICQSANNYTNSDKCATCDKVAASPKPVNQLTLANTSSCKWRCSDCWRNNDISIENCCCGGRKPKPADEPDKVEVVTPTAKASAGDKWKCSDCWVKNDDSKDKCVCCGGTRNSKKSLALPAAVPEKADIVPSVAKTSAEKSANKWKCSDCWVENEDSKDKCVCCGGKRNLIKSNALPAAVLHKADVMTSAATKDWRCDDCMITNKPSIDKCLACGGAKPGPKPGAKILPSFSSSNFFNKSDNKLAEIMEAQKSYWECTICLASNANDKKACMCCETAKDAREKSPPKLTSFKFDVEPNSGFKFGINPKVQEKNLTKKVAERLTKKESETNNNIISETPSFTFAAPIENQDYKFDDLKCNEDPKPSFSFGVPIQDPTSTASNFIFKPLTDTKLLNIVKPVEETEKPQEVPSISLTVKPTIGLQTTPAPTANPLNAMNAFLNNSSEIKAVSPNKKETTPQFTFSPMKPSSVILNTPPASVAASNLTKQDTPSQPPMLGMFAKTDATVPSPAVSFFAKSENSTPLASPFQSNSGLNTAPSAAAAPVVAAVRAAPAATLANPPMFSFGSNQSTTSEPKKFTFTFGSNTSTPMFGATPQSNVTAFGLNTNPSGPMGGSGITSNPLGVGMSSNPLGGAPSGNGNSSAPMFNAPAKDNASMWPNTNEQPNQVIPFMSTQTKPAFSFGATPTPSPFGTPANNIAQAPIVFGGTPQPAQNMFGMNQNNTSQPSMFSNPAPSQQPSPMFGNSTLPMFGVPNASPFGTSTPSMSTFEAPAMAPAAFNFGAQQSSPAVFGFGQQAGNAMQGMQGIQGMQGMQAEVRTSAFSFGASPAGGQMQFSMGSAPNTGRRVRKAVRRNPQR